MKKLLILLSAMFLFIGCGGPSNTNSPAPTIQASISPQEINQGETATLTWVAENATSVEIDGFPDATSTKGVITVSPTTTTTYTIRALAPNAQAAVKQLTLTVIPLVLPPPPGSSDDDHDGVPNTIDLCPGTPAGSTVDATGCVPPTQGVVTITITWALPTTYTDGTPIEADNSVKLVTEIYMKTTADPVIIGTDIPLVVSGPGEVSATVNNVTVDLGVTYYFRARIHIAPDGGWSEFSPEVPHTWY